MAYRGGVTKLAAFGVDVVLVLIFALVGRLSHAERLKAMDVLTTAWPFLVALVIGWVVTLSWRRTFGLLPALGVWVVTAGGGLLIRKLSGDSTQVPFILVTIFTLGFLLLAWRLIGFLESSRRRRAREASAATTA